MPASGEVGVSVEPVGWAEGLDGLKVEGNLEGRMVGTMVGLVGRAVGVMVGLVGFLVGAKDGKLGLVVGLEEGVFVGSAVGALEGLRLGAGDVATHRSRQSKNATARITKTSFIWASRNLVPVKSCGNFRIWSVAQAAFIQFVP